MIVNRPQQLRSTITAGPEGTEISIPIYGLVSLAWFICAILLAAIECLLLLCAIASSEALVLALFLSPVAVGFMLAALRGPCPTVLFLRPNRLVVRKHIGGIGRSRFFDADEIFDLRSWWIEEEAGTEHICPGILFAYRGKEYRFAINQMPRDEADYLVSLIKNCYPKVNVIYLGPLETMGVAPLLLH